MKIIRNLLLKRDMEKFNQEIYDVGDWDGLSEENATHLSNEDAKKYQDVCNAIPTWEEDNTVLYHSFADRLFKSKEMAKFFSENEKELTRYASDVIGASLWSIKEKMHTANSYELLDLLDVCCDAEREIECRENEVFNLVMMYRNDAFEKGLENKDDMKKIYDDTMAFNTPIETPERPFFDFDDVFAYINELCMFETNNEKDWPREEFDNFYYFKLEKWKKVKNSNKMIKKCEWYIINQKPVYFKRWDYSRHLRFCANDYFRTPLTEGQDLNILHPFHVGDILKVDMRPFMPVRNILLLEKGNWDCCSMQVAYIDEYDKLCTGAFKHSDISNYYLYRNHPICSPFFTLTKENVVLKEKEKVFLDLQKEIDGDETKGREVWNKIINW